jgi:DNA polymerase elongation subunit (family B)
MQEVWINTKAEWVDFNSYLNEEGIGAQLCGKDAEGWLKLSAGEFIAHVHPEITIRSNITLPKITKYDPLIFGKDGTENVTNITVDNEQVFIYKSDGSVDIQEYFNWAIGCNYDDGCTRLKGHQYYKYIKDLPEDQFYMLKDNWNPRIWTPRTAAEGFMLRSGMTYYKGMKVSDVSLLSFDIEATSLDKNDPIAFVPLVSSTYRDKKGQIQKRMFDVFEYADQKLMWQDINKHIQTCNPDVILGHNILSYDLPYLDKNSTGLNWGKDGGRIFFEEKVSKIRKDSSQQYEFHNVYINGREVVDTFFLSLKYDIAREFPSYGLKAIEKYLGFVKEDRSWDFTKWSVKKLIEAKKAGNNEIWEQFRQYCADDSDSPIKMFDLMIPSFFYLCQSVPKTLQQMICEASGSQLDSLMIRSYLQEGQSLPRSSKKEEFEGAISMGVPGIYENVRKVDVASLYPSIMLQYEIYDKKKDPERNMLKMLEYFRNERLANKKKAKETGDKYYDDLQNAQKIMINSMYGFMGAGYLLFNYPVGAAEVTRYGREILLKGVEAFIGHTLTKVVKSTRNEGTEDEEERFHWIIGDKVGDGLGYTLVNVDTDSFSYTNGILPTKAEFDKELKDLNSLYPSLISWEKDGEDGIFDKIIVVKAKNYVLVRKGKVKYKGSSLTDQKKEPRLLRLLEELISVLLYADKIEKEKELVGFYNECCKEVAFKFNVHDWKMKKTITDSVLNAKRLNEAKIFTACQDAIKNGIISGIQGGDKVYLYQAIAGEIQDSAKGELIFSKKGIPKMIDNCILKFVELYNQDHDKWHYVERVYNTLKILENVIDISQFEKYHLKKNREKLV